MHISPCQKTSTNNSSKTQVTAEYSNSPVKSRRFLEEFTDETAQFSSVTDSSNALYQSFYTASGSNVPGNIGLLGVGGL